MHEQVKIWVTFNSQPHTVPIKEVHKPLHIKPAQTRTIFNQAPRFAANPNYKNGALLVPYILDSNRCI